MSRNRWTGPIAKLFLGRHNENYHLVHHLKPKVPYWNLPKVHQIMMRDSNYREVQQREIGFVWPMISGVPSIILSIIFCKPLVKMEHGSSDKVAA